MRGGRGGMWIWLGRLRGRFIDGMGGWGVFFMGKVADTLFL